ncbi:hypothetical protein AB0B05_39910 [Streptomyces chrestomyceticus]
MGRTLCEAATPFLQWTTEHLAHIDAALAAYDARADPSTSVKDHA